MFIEIDQAPDYLVNEFGEVKNKHTGRILKPQRDKQGYCKVRLYDNFKKFKDYYVHKLVAAYHIEIPKDVDPDSYESLVVDHIDGNRQNNAASNLKYALRSNHMSDLHKSGKVYTNYTGHGQVPIMITDGAISKSFPSIAEAAVWIHSILKDPKPTLTSVKVMCSLLANGKVKSAYGFKLI